MYQCVDCAGNHGHDHFFTTRAMVPRCPKCKREPVVVAFPTPKVPYHVRAARLLAQHKEGV